MRLHNAGKYNGDESSLPQREHPEGYVPFREAENMKKFAVKMNIIAVVLLIFMLLLFYIRMFIHMRSGFIVDMSFAFHTSRRFGLEKECSGLPTRRAKSWM